MAEADNFNSQYRPLVGGIAIMPSDGEEHRGTLGAIAKAQIGCGQGHERTPIAATTLRCNVPKEG